VLPHDRWGRPGIDARITTRLSKFLGEGQTVRLNPGFDEHHDVCIEGRARFCNIKGLSPTIDPGMDVEARDTEFKSAHVLMITAPALAIAAGDVVCVYRARRTRFSCGHRSSGMAKNFEEP
jgi:hypothetical protein